MNDYLWDRKGDVDEEVQRLEELLRAYRAPQQPLRFRRRRAPLFFAVPIAAMLLLGIALPAFLAYRASGWRAGAIAVYRPGDVVHATRALRLETPSIGVVDVRPGTTLRIVEKRRLALDVGAIHARTTSPPGLFIVDTPRTQAIDLGCEYTLDVAKDGSGALHVTEGWVDLTRGWTQSLVPRGASAAFDAEGNLTVPLFDDASPQFKDAVRRGDVARIAALARTRDALTLLNLFSRVGADERLIVYDRLAQLVPPPPPITRESVRWWTPLTTEPWWRPVLKASGVAAINKKKTSPTGIAAVP